MTNQEKIDLIKSKLLGFVSKTHKFSSIKTTDGIEIESDDTITLESIVWTKNEDGEKTDLEDGSYKLNNGYTAMVRDGKVIGMMKTEDEQLSVETQDEDEQKIKVLLLRLRQKNYQKKVKMLPNKQVMQLKQLLNQMDWMLNKLLKY